ncbi:MAG: GNAT family N-acetyltransferase [Sphingobacterium sp.]|jgi:diamine N-acetyltransferase|nr:GNAT family N-acetyltransferase [Sphingobacterium sp.]
MSVILKEVTAGNYYEVGLLTTNQSGMPTFDEEFICANSVSIAESKYYPKLHPQAIYANDILIGFILSGPYIDDDDNFWILRYMIDYKYQGKGYGKRALLSFIEQIRQKGLVQEIFLGLDAANEKAIKVYTACGFRFTGVIKQGEQIYCLTIQD